MLITLDVYILAMVILNKWHRETLKSPVFEFDK